MSQLAEEVLKTPVKRNLADRINRHWTTQELVTIGVFASVIKASSLLVAFMGGGMNPVTLMAKNCLYTMLLLTLLHKVPKLGTLTLVTMVTAFVSILLMGQGILHTPGAFLACFVAELAIWALGGYGSTRNLVLGVLIYESCAKILGLVMSYLSLREQPAMLIPIMIFLSIGAMGSLLGLYLGTKFTRELRHASIISN